MARERLGRAAPIVAAVLALVGLAVSAASLADTLGTAPAFCAESGCASVRATAWAHPLGIPLPLLGLAFFAGALVLDAAGPRAAVARHAWALGGGLVGVGLVLVQALAIGHWCRLCLIADAAAIAHGALVFTASSSTWPRAVSGRVVTFAVLAVAAIAIPLGARRMDATGRAAAGGALPAVVVREQVPGTVVVVDFVDFECPFCRQLHGRLVQAIARVGAPVRIVRKMVPLGQHRGAMPAARAWVCADAQGRGDAMAEALLATPPERLTPSGCENIARSVGVDLARYRSDLAAPATQERIAADLADARDAGVHSLPTVYIGDRVFAGASATVDDLVAALERATRT